jgi:hypothetical protein
MHSTSSCWPPELAGKQCPKNSQEGSHVEIPKDNTDEWEINFKALAFQDKVASGTYGDLYRGTYFGEDVAIKVLKSDRLNENMEKEFAHEVYIMRSVTKSVIKFQKRKRMHASGPVVGRLFTCLVLTDPVSYPRLIRPARAPISFSGCRALGLNVLFLKKRKIKGVTCDSQLKTLIVLLLRQYAEPKKAHLFLYWSLFPW